MLAQCVLVLATLKLASAGNPVQVQVGEPVGLLTLNDQYEHPFQLSDLHGSVTVLIDGDRTGSQFNGVWGSAVRSRYKSSGDRHVAVVFIAQLASVPAFMRGFVQKKFLGKDSAHPAGRILLDWHGVVADRFGFRADVSNVYVIDREGVLRYKGSGKGVGADLDPVFHLVDEILAH
jgi:predicted transcriptional regulator